MAQQSSHFLMLLFSLYYVFSIIGMHMLNRGMIGSNEHLQSTAWYETTYMPSSNPNQTITNNNNLNIQSNSQQQQQQQQNLTGSTYKSDAVSKCSCNYRY